MPGARDPLYVLARRVLLDALEKLEEHRENLILVGAQAIYLHTGETEFPAAEFTTDGDIAIDPSGLKPAPKLDELLAGAGFTTDPAEVGRWVARPRFEGRPVEVPVDFLVPEAVGGGGRRGARLGEHGRHIARKAKGLEAALVDRSKMVIESLEDGDSRKSEVDVAGPAALLVAKLHKIGERVGPGRAEDKDALDVLRLLRTLSTGDLAKGLRRLLEDEMSGRVTVEALDLLRELFASPTAEGSHMAARAAAPEPEDEIIASCAALAGDLLQAMSSGHDE
jgi:hypothetical protein